jgi:phosphate transport system permease protein
LTPEAVRPPGRSPQTPPGLYAGPAGVDLRSTGKLGDRLFRGAAVLFSALIIVVTFAIGWSLWQNSRLAREAFGFSFLWGRVWDPVAGEFGALPFLYGTLVSSLLALVLAVPLGVGAALFLSELAPRKISDLLSFLTELLAAVPSVIYGLLGIFVLVPLVRNHVEPFLGETLGFLPLFQGPPLGIGMLSAGLILAVMIIPFIITVSREVLLTVPSILREGALALGATRWEVAWHVALPFARSGIVGAVFLALARALGETMAVTMVIGNSPEISASLFAPGYTMAAVLANEFTEATEDLYLHALIAIGLVLFGVTFVINGLARLLVWSVQRKYR